MPRLSLTSMRAFSMLVAGQFISTVGSGMRRFGLGVWVYAETGDTRAYTMLVFFAIVLVSAALPAVRCLEDRLSDHDSSGAPPLAAGVAPEAAGGLPGPPTYPPLDDRR